MDSRNVVLGDGSVLGGDGNGGGGIVVQSDQDTAADAIGGSRDRVGSYGDVGAGMVGVR